MLGARFHWTNNTIAIGKLHGHSDIMHRNIKFVRLDMGSAWAHRLVILNRRIRFYNGDLQPIHHGAMTIHGRLHGFKLKHT